MDGTYVVVDANVNDEDLDYMWCVGWRYTARCVKPKPHQLER